jgi:hypothetical protein
MLGLWRMDPRCLVSCPFQILRALIKIHTKTLLYSTLLDQNSTLAVVVVTTSPPTTIVDIVVDLGLAALPSGPRSFIADPLLVLDQIESIPQPSPITPSKRLAPPLIPSSPPLSFVAAKGAGRHGLPSKFRNSMLPPVRHRQIGWAYRRRRAGSTGSAGSFLC